MRVVIQAMQVYGAAIITFILFMPGNRSSFECSGTDGTRQIMTRMQNTLQNIIRRIRPSKDRNVNCQSVCMDLLFCRFD